MNTNSLQDRLKALGVQLGPQNPQNRPSEITSSVYSIDQIITGRIHDTIFGPAFIHSEQYDQPYYHGKNDLFYDVDLKMMAEWGKLKDHQSIDLSKIVFLDTETSGLAGGTGTYAFLVGIGWFSDNGFIVEQIFLRSPDEEAGFLTALTERIAPFQFVVTFNGKSFDIPLLTTRFIMNRLTYPMKNFGHLDLLHLARRFWRDRLSNRSLGELEKTILNFRRTEDEVPGYLIPELYFDYLRKGDARPLEGVFYHNTVDIVSLAALFKYSALILSNPLSGDIPSLDRAAIARLYDELGYYEVAASLYEQSIEQGLPLHIFLRTLQRYAWMCRKNGDWTGALKIWEKAAAHNDLAAFIELAKYYEHRARDPIKALEWVQKGLETNIDTTVPLYVRQTIGEELNRRKTRLLKKLLRE